MWAASRGRRGGPFAPFVPPARPACWPPRNLICALLFHSTPTGGGAPCVRAAYPGFNEALPPPISFFEVVHLAPTPHQRRHGPSPPWPPEPPPCTSVPSLVAMQCLFHPPPSSLSVQSQCVRQGTLPPPPLLPLRVSYVYTPTTPTQRASCRAAFGRRVQRLCPGCWPASSLAPPPPSPPPPRSAQHLFAFFGFGGGAPSPCFSQPRRPFLPGPSPSMGASLLHQ